MQQRTQEFRKVVRADVEKNLDTIDKVVPSLQKMKQQATEIASDMTYVFSAMPVEETLGNFGIMFSVLSGSFPLFLFIFNVSISIRSKGTFIFVFFFISYFLF